MILLLLVVSAVMCVVGTTGIRAQTSDLVFANGTLSSGEKNEVCLTSTDPTGTVTTLPEFTCTTVDELLETGSSSAVSPSRDVAYKEQGGDLNGDKIPDLVFDNRRSKPFGNTTPAQAQVCLNQDTLRNDVLISSYLSSCYQIDSRQAVGVSIADLDGDGDNDLAFANPNRPSRVCMNDGSGNFTCNDVSGGPRQATDVAVAGLNEDTDFDLVYSVSQSSSGESNEVCLNDGTGSFTCSDVSSRQNRSTGVATGFVDSDLDADVIFSNTRSGGDQNTVCANDGNGNFTCKDVSGGTDRSSGVALGIRGNRVAVFANQGDQKNEVCTYDGSGSGTGSINFSCSDISATDAEDDATNYTRDVDIGDVGRTERLNAKLDVAFANDGQANRVCYNVADQQNRTCTSDFTGSGTQSPEKASFGVAIGNVDGDGSIRVVKDTDPNDSQDFPFAFIDPRPNIGLNTDTTTFSLVDDGQFPSSSRSASFGNLGRDTTYTILEREAPKQWVLHDLVCDVVGPSPFPTFQGTQSLLHALVKDTLRFGQQVTCRFINKNASTASGTGTVQIEKFTDPPGASKPFPFGGDLGSFTITPGVNRFFTKSGLVTGRYVVAEGPVSEYVLRDASCTGAKWTSGFTFPDDGYRDQGGVAFLVKENNTTTCRFQNDKLSTITVEKNTKSGSSSIQSNTDFEILGVLGIKSTKEGVSSFSTLLNTDPSSSNPKKYTQNKIIPSSNFPPPTTNLFEGTYKIIERLKYDRFVISNITSSAKVYKKIIPSNGEELLGGPRTSTSRIIIDVPPGGSANVQVENKKGGSVVMKKDTKPDNTKDFSYTLRKGGQKLVGFQLDDMGGDGTASERRGDLLPGTYTVTEAKEPNWTTTDIKCRDTPTGGTTVDSTQQKATIDLEKGDVVVCTFVNEHPSRDYGDAPDQVSQKGYPTYKSHDGASHKVETGFFLGSKVDLEKDGQPTPDADGDDNSGQDDEDGVRLPSALRTGHKTDVIVSAAVPGKLDAWIDFNGDQTWQAGEKIASNRQLSQGSNLIEFTVPKNASAGATFARFRFSTGGGLPPTGPAGLGEVEDYKVEIVKGASSPASVSGSPSSEGAQLEWSASEGEEVAGYYIYRDTAPISSSTSPSALTPYDSTDAETTNYIDTGAKSGQTYYYRVTALNSEGVESPSLSEQVQVFLYPEEIAVEASRSFGDASQAADYRLVALPGQVERPLAETASGEPGTDWQASWDDGSSEEFFVKFDGSETFTFRPGRAFWLTHLEEWAVEESIQTVQLQGDSATTIPLHEGWNIISNPLDKNVAWGHVTAENGGDLQPLWAFDGSFAQADSFRSARSGVAYYFHNSAGLDLLTVPYPGSPPETVEGSKAKQKAGLQVLTLTARPGSEETSSGGTGSSVHVGTARAANEGKDPLDVLAPPSQFSKVALRLKAPKAVREAGLPARQYRWARDVRPNGAKGTRYSLLLRGKPGTSVRLSPEGLDAFSERRAALLDPSRGTSYDLRSGGTVELSLQDSTRALKLALGNEEYVRSQKRAIRPDEVTLTSYPNPFRQQSNLVYTLPEKTEVRLTIYDVLGRRVTVLADGRRPAGRHRVQLRTSQLSGLSSGMYFARLKAAGKTLTHKITVVR